MLVHELSPARSQPLGDGGMKERSEPRCGALVEDPGRSRHRGTGYPGHACHQPPASVPVHDLIATQVPDEPVVHDDLIAVRMVLRRCSPLEGGPDEHKSEPDGDVPHDGLQQWPGREADLHRQPEGPRLRDHRLEAGHVDLHVERALHSPTRRPAPCRRAAVEDPDQRVARELRDAAPVARDHTAHHVEPAVEDSGQFLGAVVAGSGQCLAHSVYYETPVINGVRLTAAAVTYHFEGTLNFSRDADEWLVASLDEFKPANRESADYIAPVDPE
jgi:hypothetical protein